MSHWDSIITRLGEVCHIFSVVPEWKGSQGWCIRHCTDQAFSGTVQTGKPTVSHGKGSIYCSSVCLWVLTKPHTAESRPCKLCRAGPRKEKAKEIKTQRDPKTHSEGEKMGHTE